MAEPGTDYEPADRRPIASREHAIWQRLAARLAAAGVSPNAISVGGMVVAVAAGGLLAATPAAGRGAWVCFIAAAVGIQLRLLANMLDGMVAVTGGRASAVGELYNELPDRASDFAVLVGAGYAVGGVSWLGFTSAAAAIATAYVRAVGKSAGAAGLFQGPMAKPHRMAVVEAACLLLAVLPRRLQPAWHGCGLMSVALGIVILGCVVTGWRRVAATAAHLRGAAA